MKLCRDILNILNNICKLRCSFFWDDIPVDVVLMFLLLILNIFYTFFYASIVNFEQVDVSWVKIDWHQHKCFGQCKVQGTCMLIPYLYAQFFISIFFIDKTRFLQFIYFWIKWPETVQKATNFIFFTKDFCLFWSIIISFAKRTSTKTTPFL